MTGWPLRLALYPAYPLAWPARQWPEVALGQPPTPYPCASPAYDWVPLRALVTTPNSHYNSVIYNGRTNGFP